MVKLSIIIPTYNRTLMLKRALQSIHSEHMDIIEVIVCDDDTDSYICMQNKRLCEEVQVQKGCRITFLRNMYSHGPAGARNYGILQSKGEWLLFLDDDDELVNGYIDYLLEYLQKSIFFDVVWSNVIICRKIFNSEKQIKRIYTPKNLEERYKDFSSIGLGYGVCIKKDICIICKGFDEKLPVAEDTDLFFKIICKNIPVKNLDYFGVKIHDHNLKKLTGNYKFHIENRIFLILFHKYKKELKEKKLVYLSFCAWISEIYIHEKMYNKALLFNFEFLIANFFSYDTWLLFFKEFKKLVHGGK